MGVSYYEWGQVPGSSGGGGGGGTASSGPPETFTGALGPGVTVIAFSANTITVTVRNTHDTDSLDYSFDGGVTYLTLGHYEIAHESIKVASMRLKPTVGGTNPTYEIIAALTP